MSTSEPGSTNATTPTTVLGPVVSVETAAELATSASIGLQGGTLSAAAGAITYTLVVPPGALASPVEITMTPITAVTGQPLDGPIEGGVTFAPAGLLLAEPALLTIAGGPAVQGSVAFGFDNAGQDFHLVPFVPGDGVLLPIRHFSGVAYTQASDALLARTAAMQITNDFSALDNDIGAYGATYRQRFGSEADPNARQVWEDFAVKADQLTVEGLAAAEADPLALGPPMVLEVLAMYRELTLLSGDPGYFSMNDANNLADKVDAALDKLCAERSADPVATATAILGMERMRQIAGLRSDAAEVTLGDVQARLAKCSFKLFATPTIVWHGVDVVSSSTFGPPETHDMTLSGQRVELVLATEEAKLCPDPIPPELDAAFCAHTVTTYRWKAKIPLTFSDFKTNDQCWTKAAWYTVEDFEPMLTVDIEPDADVRKVLTGKIAEGATPTKDAAVILELTGGVIEPTFKEDISSGPCAYDIGNGLELDISWSAIGGAAPQPARFAGGVMTWTRTSPPGTGQSGSARGSYTITATVTFSTESA